ncbi:MAG: FAD-binding oxidoreductase [Deltaproteobacteria bacterium]|nr:FAD-binding oxidoreductase [Deltaproteobacteria bacterium]MBW2412870.1 FAD-binding oxidoreductase [Deltaproteobacteria bacterium]
MEAEQGSLDHVPIRATWSPSDASEVAAMLDKARGDGLAVVPAGGRTKLHWGNRSDAECVALLDLSRLRDPLDVQGDEGIAIVGAGVPVRELERAARAVGKRTRLPALWDAATVGGTIAADPVGPATRPHQRLRDELLGLEVALANGELTRSGGQVVKNVTGFDLVRLYCGSLGTLGVITRVTLRLWPLPELRVVRLREVASVDTAIQTAHAIVARGVDPAGLAVLPGPSGARVVCAVEGSRVDAEERAVRVAGETVGEDVWTEAERQVSGSQEPVDGCDVRVSGRASDTLPIARAVADAGGGLRVALPALGTVFARVAADALDALEARAVRERWAFFVERAAPEVKSARDVFGPPPDALPLMRRLKALFDPERVLSPGRFVGGI